MLHQHSKSNKKTEVSKGSSLMPSGDAECSKTTSRYSYIVLVSTGIGGAEKRFFDIFRACLQTNKSVFLVLSAALHKKLAVDSDENLIIIGQPEDNLLRFCRQYSQWLRGMNGKEAVFHYPMNCLFFLHLFKPHQLSMSLTNCYEPPALFTPKRSLLRQYITSMFVSRIDVLSPAIYQQVSKFTLTPKGTYIYPEPEKLPVKDRLYGFIGRLIPGKGLEGFLNILPEVWNLLQLSSDSEFTFFIAGYGPLELMVEQRVAELAVNGIPIVFYGYVPAEDILKKAQLVFSLQEKTNYPSRVVAEAMLNGCSVLVTDSGDSRCFGEFDEGLTYISKQLKASELATAIQTTASKYEEDSSYAQKVRRAGAKRFSSEEVVDYFLDILKYRQS